MDNLRIYHDENCNLFKNSEIYFNKDSYIVSLNSKIVGHFNVTKLGNDLLLDYELLKEYRNIGLGDYFFKIIEKYVVNNFEFNKIILMIKYDNEKSKNIAAKNDYKIDYEFISENDIYGEMTMYNPYSKRKCLKK